MKELPLSLLSRGCGHLVPLQEGGHDGRLEVCFEPEDYFSWRAQPLLLRLSRSGRLLGGGVEDPTPPKTYSTRKGHLILYSEDLVSSSSQSAASRKGQGSKQEAGPPLHTLRDLTGAILAYKRKQPREGHAAGEGHPLLSRLTPPSHTHLSAAQCHPRDRLSQLTDSLDEVPSSGRLPPAPTPVAPAQVLYHPRFLCSPRPSHAPSEPLPPITEGLLSQRGDGRGHLQKDIGGTSALGDFECPLTLTDEGGPHSGQSQANIPSAPMILCCSPERGPQQEAAERARSEETHEPAHLHGSGCAENTRCLGKCSLKRANVDSTWRSSRLSHISFYGGHLAGSHRVNTGQYARMGLNGRRKDDMMSDPSFSILRLPPLPRGPVVRAGSDGHAPQDHGGSSMTLPPIPEGVPLTHTHTPATPAQRPDTPALDLTHTQPRPKMADSRDTATVRESERHAPRRILLLIPRATREEKAERSGGVIHGIHAAENEVKERGGREHREKERPMDNDTREMDRGNGTEEGEKERGMDKEMREKRRKRDADDDVGASGERGEARLQRGQQESGERGEARLQRGQPQQEEQESGQQAFTLVGLNHQHLLLLETQDGAPLPPSLGTLPPLAGRRGPGKQSSMATYRHNPPEPPEPGQSQPSVVRGSIPVELRDWQKGGGWGTLIMGPDGDIIRLSLWDPTGQQQLSLDDVTEEHAVRILVSEGEEAGQSWTLLLEPEATVPGEHCSGKADVTSDNREASHSSMRRVARAGVCVDEIKSEGRCGSATDNSAPAEGQSQISSPPQTPERRGAASGDRPVSTGKEADKRPGVRGRIAQDTGSDRRREIDRAEGGEDELPVARGDAGSPSALGDDSSPPSRPTIPPADAPSGPSIPQCLSGGDAEAKEACTKTAGVTPSVRDVERERRGGGGGEKGGRRDRKRGEEEQSGGQERQKAPLREEKGRQAEAGLPEEQEEEEEKEEVGERRRPSEKEKGAPTASSVRKRERKTKGENKKGTKEGAGASKAQRAGGKRGGRARVKGQDVFVVGKPRPKQQVVHPEQEVEKSERKSTEEDEPLGEQEEEEEQQSPGDDNIGHIGDTVERPNSTRQGSASSSRSQHSDDRSAPVSRGQSSRQASLPGEVPPSSPPPMSLHQLTSRSASTATDSYVTKPSQSEEGAHVNNSRNAEEVAKQRERQAAARAEKAERRRQEVERKRREREEEKRRLQEREETEERMRLELEEEQRRRAEEASLKRRQEEEERERREAEQQERGRREEAERERERRRQEEKRRQMERMQRLRQEEEKRRAEEQERVRVEEEQRRAEERRRLQQMEESERSAYLQRLQEEEEQRSRAEEERRRREEEALLWAKEQARIQAQLQARQRALLEQRLSFQRGLQQEAGGLGQSQDISRPWVFSYFTLLQLLGLTDPTSSAEGPGPGPDSPQPTPT